MINFLRNIDTETGGSPDTPENYGIFSDRGYDENNGSPNDTYVDNEDGSSSKLTRTFSRSHRGDEPAGYKPLRFNNDREITEFSDLPGTETRVVAFYKTAYGGYSHMTGTIEKSGDRFIFSYKNSIESEYVHSADMEDFFRFEFLDAPKTRPAPATVVTMKEESAPGVAI